MQRRTWSRSRDGWFRTGDVGRMDADGHIVISGRVSHMFISAGSNVYPREIEKKILTHPAIDDVAVVGTPDHEWREVGVAVCVLKPGSEITEADLAAFTAGKVSKYKLPRRIFCEMPCPTPATARCRSAHYARCSRNGGGEPARPE